MFIYEGFLKKCIILRHMSIVRQIQILLKFVDRATKKKNYTRHQLNFLYNGGTPKKKKKLNAAGLNVFNFFNYFVFILCASQSTPTIKKLCENVFAVNSITGHKKKPKNFHFDDFEYFIIK